jgi:hypothetical protein
MLPARGEKDKEAEFRDAKYGGSGTGTGGARLSLKRLV